MSRSLRSSWCRTHRNRWARRSASSTSVPVTLWITQAGADGDSSITVSLHTLKHVLSKTFNSPLMIIMRQQQKAALARNLSVQSTIKIVFRIDDCLLGIVVIVLSVQVSSDIVVSQVGQTGLAGGVTGELRWTHVSWEEAEDVVDGALVVVHLLVEGG